MRLALLSMLILTITVAARADGLRAGAAAVVITPPPGTPMAGYYYQRGADGVHDDLHAKAIVLESGGNRAALVALDLISTTRDLVEDARRQIEGTARVPGRAVMISATHAHTGPVIAGRSVRENALGGRSGPALEYRAALPAKIAEAVRRAEAKLEPARLFVAHGHEASIAFNRRYHMADGSVGWNPGKRNTKIAKPAGTIDPDVPVVYVESAIGRPIATYVNYAVHFDNVGGTQISADVAYTLSRLLGEYKGPEMVTLFTAGCCGDVNHLDVRWADAQKGHENAARMGIILAAEVLRTWPVLEPVEPGRIQIQSDMVDLPLAPLSSGAVERARAVVARREDKEHPPSFLEQVDAFKTLDVAERQGKPLQVEVQAVTLGDRIAWVSLPGEIFVELGLEIKQDSPFANTLIAELANGAIGYVPARRAYTQGNYEVVSARCAEGSGERLVDTAVRLLKHLHSEATPSTGPGDR
jgi:hypothetical protein